MHTKKNYFIYTKGTSQRAENTQIYLAIFVLLLKNWYAYANS